MVKQKSAHAFQHEHREDWMMKDLGGLVNNGVGGDNTKHKSSG